jgi:hypothetical protein
MGFQSIVGLTSLQGGMEVVVRMTLQPARFYNNIYMARARAAEIGDRRINAARRSNDIKRMDVRRFGIVQVRVRPPTISGTDLQSCQLRAW